MELTSAVKLLVTLAAAEATLTKSVEMDPEHFFLGLLKLEDAIDRDRIRALDLPESEYDAILQEAAGVVEFWKKQNAPAKSMRRRLRFFVAEEQPQQGEFGGHRSDRGRKLFARAEEIAKSNSVSPVNLPIFLIACLEIDSKPIEMIFREFGLSRDSLIEAARQDLLGTEKKKDNGKPKQKSPAHPIAKYGRDLTALARDGRLGPVIGRDEEIKQVARILTQRSKNNPILLGDPGVGKTAVVEGLALYAAAENAVDPLRRLHFVEISMSALVAGTMYRGQFEERLQEVINAAARDPNLVIFMDEIHTLIGGGAGSDTTLDAANMLKPALARGEMRCIGATTTDEYRKHIEPDGALARRFQIVWINEPTPQETLAILRGLRPRLQEHHTLEIPEELLGKVVSLSSRFITDGYQPDKAITILDEACARRRLLTIHAQPDGVQTSLLELEDIGRVIAHRTQIPLDVILQSDDERLLNLEQELARRVIGQDHALKVVAEAIRLSRAGLRAPHKPIVLLFAGPSGTGKSELAKALSEFLFFDPQRLITLDMTEYQESHSVAKIIGSPPGYVGFDEEPHLIREIRLHPYSVVLLDEIEKAHPGVLNIFLQVFDEGRLTDAHGRQINCGEAIFILTSNMGVNTVKPKSPIGFNLAREEETTPQEVLEEQVRKAIAAGLRPELLNRIQEVVVFNFLSKEVLYRILDAYLSEIQKQLEERHITISLDDSAREFLIQVGYSPEYGARHLRRAFDRWVSALLSREILAGSLRSGEHAVFTRQEERLALNVHGVQGTKTIVYQTQDGPEGKPAYH